MSKLRTLLFAICLLPFALSSVRASAPVPEGGFYNHGIDLYKAGRFSDATDSFEQAAKHKDHAQEALDYIDRIRKETVERIRNRALTGISKSNWQSKFFYMHAIGGRVQVGISIQELFENNSLNFRPGAIDALAQVAAAVAEADNMHVDIDVISEVNMEGQSNPEIETQQLTAVFSYLSLAARGQLPKY
jgi:flagellar motor protein MotB